MPLSVTYKRVIGRMNIVSARVSIASLCVYDAEVRLAAAMSLQARMLRCASFGAYKISAQL